MNIFKKKTSYNSSYITVTPNNAMRSAINIIQIINNDLPKDNNERIINLLTNISKTIFLTESAGKTYSTQDMEHTINKWIKENSENYLKGYLKMLDKYKVISKQSFIDYSKLHINYINSLSTVKGFKSVGIFLHSSGPEYWIKVENNDYETVSSCSQLYIDHLMSQNNCSFDYIVYCDDEIIDGCIPDFNILLEYKGAL